MIDLQPLIDRYVAGGTLKELSESSGIPEETLRRKLKSSGCPMRPKGYPQGKYLPSGGRIVDKHGYVLILKPDHPHKNSSGYVREHRLVMEAALGRILDPKEVIHHINGDTGDNRLENLQLYQSHSKHFSDELRGNDYWKNRKTQTGGATVAYTPESALDKVRLWVQTQGRHPLKKELSPKYNLPHYEVLEKLFGSWREALDLVPIPQQ